ncbi:MAG: YIP1 family protein [Paraclostridium bifermentans]|uniref:YIP1 family protein n=1 Tax=Paraclostridium bifermentans TaxID=1490 RepID=UPI0011DD0D81|nr:YIP1 family protein [Paraclostridium bifermentans]MBS6508585.1 YIP1 family protein [Paraclostridium bifermentans]MDU3803065.1 YIP1 family protein [Paraclostridium bifermentans]
MRDLKTLIIQPKEYFKDFTKEEYESKEPVKLRYWFIALVAISILSGVVINLMMPDLVGELGLEGMGKTGFMAFQWASYIIGPLISALICVNILYFVSKMFMGFVENEEIKDKKYFKSLLYIRFIVFSIFLAILSLITTVAVSDIQAQTIASQLNNILIKLWATYFLYGILKYYLQTKKLHKILPTILYILTLIFAIVNIVNTIMITSI